MTFPLGASYYILSAANITAPWPALRHFFPWPISLQNWLRVDGAESNKWPHTESKDKKKRQYLPSDVLFFRFEDKYSRKVLDAGSEPLSNNRRTVEL
jgi:hypothetical protein